MFFFFCCLFVYLLFLLLFKIVPVGVWGRVGMRASGNLS